MKLNVERVTFGEFGNIAEIVLHDQISITGADLAEFLKEFQKARLVNDAELINFSDGMKAAANKN
jgi:hypothetical protein